jgi:hypothetical protein
MDNSNSNSKPISNYILKSKTFLSNIDSKLVASIQQDNIDKCDDKAKNNYYSNLFCNFINVNTSNTNNRNIINPALIHESNHNNIVSISGTKSITVSSDIAIVHIYSKLNYVKEKIKYNLRQDVYLNNYNIDTTMIKYKKELVSSKFNSIIDENFPYLSSNNYKEKEEKYIVNKEKFYLLPDKMEKNLVNLLIFTTIKYNSDDNKFKSQKISVNSWIKLTSYKPDEVRVRVLILVDDIYQCKSIYTSFNNDNNNNEDKNENNNVDNVLCIPIIQCLHPIFNIPTVDCLFKTALSIAYPGELLMYSNSDIAFYNDFIDTIISATITSNNQFNNGYIMVGQRTNVANIINIENNINSINNYEKLARNKDTGKLDSVFAEDYFLMPQESYPQNFPPFLIGRATWDNIMGFW